MIRLQIDGREIYAEEGSTILEAALGAGIYIPHLCHHPELKPVGVCGLCRVEITGREGLAPACTTGAEEGMVVATKSPRSQQLRRLALELMLSRHPADCTVCSQYLNCELQSIKQYIGISEELRVRKHPQQIAADTNNPLFVRDPARCVLCGRCVRACHELRGVGVVSFLQRGKETQVGTAFGLSLTEAGCRLCGACVEVCPTGAMRDKEELVRGKNRRVALLPCKYTCPAQIDVPGYLRFIGQGDYGSAVAVIRRRVPFPRVLGYICPHPCEDQCRRALVNDPVSIRDLKRFAAERRGGEPVAVDPARKAHTGKSVAIVGAGPAGLTAGYFLSRLGHRVVVFEALPFAGGMLRAGIPAYRLPREVVDDEIGALEASGVEIRLAVKIESLAELFAQGFDALLVAVGAQQGQRLPLPGADLAGVLIGLEFLKAANGQAQITVGKRVVVVGGGNVAVDCARVARRLGASQVQMICLETKESMPATKEELAEAEEEGVIVRPARAPKAVLGEKGQVCGVECLAVESFFFDEDGAVHMETIPCSEEVIPADTVILAVGQRPRIPEGFNLALRGRGTIEVDPFSGETSQRGVFACGDAAEGPTSAIKAMASGREAASFVDRYLGGTGELEEGLAPLERIEPWLGRDEGFVAARRHVASKRAAVERLGGFCHPGGLLDETSAPAEAKRCLQCDLRLRLKPVKFWGDY